jgi:hypothetical protein
MFPLCLSAWFFACGSDGSGPGIEVTTGGSTHSGGGSAGTSSGGSAGSGGNQQGNEAGSSSGDDALPEALDDQAVTGMGVPVHVRVLDNDEGEELVLESFENGKGGTVVEHSDGVLSYVPDEDFDGEDSFSYTVRDAHGEVATATVTVNVLPRLGTVAGGRLYVGTAHRRPDQPGGTAWFGLSEAGHKVGSGPGLLFQDTDGEFVDIDLPVGYGSGGMKGVNAHGVAVGFVSGPAPDYAIYSFRWSPGGEAEVFGDASYSAEAIGDDGTVVGAFFDDDYIASGYILPDGETPTLFKVPDSSNTYPSDLLPDGSIFGTAHFSGQPNRCFLRSPSGEFELSDPAEPWSTYPGVACRGRNNAGWRVGSVSPVPAPKKNDAALVGAPGEPMTRIHFPFPPLFGAVNRGELLMDIAESGTMVGYTYEVVPYMDGFAVRTRRVFHAIELESVEALRGTFFEDTPFGYVEQTMLY